ncbi:RNA polymerase I-specific transcription initiation factor RRN6-like protein [Podospora conica]|nr:RNA polymerase I-specific transcription initiation factor RRN6-like protein [Schizothecium conicum]
MADPKQLKASAKKHPPPKQRIDAVVGRLTYVPSWVGAGAAEGVGSLQRTRGTAETPRFQQLTPFDEWCPPSLVPDPPPPADTRPTEVLKSIKKSLRRAYPEIGFVDYGAKELVLDEIYDAFHPPGQPPPTTSNYLLAVGDISDLSVPTSHAKGLAAVAHATGESAHILRLARLVREEWTWEESPDVRVSLNALDHGISVEWFQDVLPITTIKFASDIRKWAPIRWLIVQKASSTTLLEPEVKRVATFDGAFRSGSSQPRSSRLSANPLFTIRAFETGGRSQTGVSFRPVVDGKPPQLAIIDECGSWSIWNITGLRSERPKNLTPIQVLCGHILTGSLYPLPEKGTSAPEPHMVLWLALDRSASKARRRQELEREDGQREYPAAPSSESVDEKERKTHVLLMCNRLGLYLFDTQANRTQNFTHVVTSYVGQGVLDMKPSPFHASQAFVLTSTTLSWVHVAEGADGRINVSLLASCPHRRNIRDPGLRLDISPAAYIHRQKACFACIRSEKDAQMTAIWFFNAPPGSPVQYRRETISFDRMPSITSMSLLPVSRHVSPDETTRSSGSVAKTEARFFQVVALSEELGLGSTLCLWSDAPDIKIPPPDRFIRSGVTSEPWRERKALQRLLKKTFAVPDSLDENPGQETQDMHLEVAARPTVRKPKTKTFTLLGALLPEHETEVKGRQDREIESQEKANPYRINDAVRELQIGDWMPLRSLLDLVGPDRSLANLVRFYKAWDNVTILDLNHHESEWHSVPLVGHGVSDDSDVNDVAIKLGKLFAVAHKRPYSLTQRIVFETFLSETFIAVGPQAPSITHLQSLHASRSLPPIPPSSLLDDAYHSSPPAIFSQELPTLPNSTQDSQHHEPAPPGLVIHEFAPIRRVFPDEGGNTELLSHWKLGTDVATVDWDPIEEAEDRANRLRLQRKQERRRQKAEKKRTMAEEMGLRSVAARVAATSQASVPIILASERSVAPSSSQWPSIQTAPTSSMSQVVPGVYGGRAVKKAPKRKAGFR